MQLVQQSTGTDFNRYPFHFLTLQRRMRELKGEMLGGLNLKILSFVCSTGEELLTIRAYFPHAAIFGCDKNSDALKTARERTGNARVHLFDSSETAISSHGPYDIIFANSVLCQNPVPKDLKNLTELFPFSLFAEICELLSSCLTTGGALQITNASYSFSDVKLSDRMVPLDRPYYAANGFVSLFFPNGERATKGWIEGVASLNYRHSILADGLTDDKLRNCIFVKLGDHTNYRTLSQFSTLAAPVGRLVAGRDPFKFGSAQVITAGLFDEPIYFDGNNFMRRRWLKNSLNGEVISFGSWDIPGHE